MASLSFTIGDAVMNVLAFNGTNSLFGKLIDHGKNKHKRQFGARADSEGQRQMS